MARLHVRLTLLLLAAAALGLLAHGAVVRWPLPALLELVNRGWGWSLHAPAPWSPAAVALALFLIVPPLAWAAAGATLPMVRLLRAMRGAVLAYREGDFSVSIAARGSGEFGDLLAAHAALGEALREQRRELAQRELLLDTVVQHTPLAMLLCAEGGAVVYANIAARQLLAGGRGVVGRTLAQVLDGAPPALAAALDSGADQLLPLVLDGAEEYLHVSQRALRLHGLPHRLILLRRMTRELAREEVASWKRVIRVVSHELNNALAPISSLAHSGAELARRGDVGRLPPVFERIGERAAHLHTFLSGYAAFAKLPAPRPQPVDWPAFVGRLRVQSPFALDGECPAAAGCFDAAQVEQALTNLLKNAHESGSPPEAVTLSIARRGDELRFTVADRGPGMSDTVLAQALLPFYSTKRSGSGLGLALAREIAEAHGGRLLLANREGGGLAAALCLPACD